MATNIWPSFKSGIKTFETGCHHGNYRADYSIHDEMGKVIKGEASTTSQAFMKIE